MKFSVTNKIFLYTRVHLIQSKVRTPIKRFIYEETINQRKKQGKCVCVSM